MEEKITYVEWKSEYSVGLPFIDEQHQALIELTNKLYEACIESSDAAQEYFKEVIRKTLEYVNFHFSAEEKLLTSVKYPEYPAHKRQHESFVKKIEEEIQKFQKGQAVAYVFVNYLKEWILNHIAVHDKAYSQYVLQRKKEEEKRA
ncbi:MAG: bacteriohemerythrin [Spirochaetaceae bacterium]|jgi:hemerythrin|nr:bacteriohemerythrin [Spirochaetaceae bacterium]